MCPDSLRRFALTFAAGAALLTAAGIGPPGCAAGESARPPFQAPAECGRLAARGTDIVCGDGRRFQWRGVTAFALLEQIAHGRRRDADAYMRWARETGFNLVRVLAMADVLFKLSPEDGHRHMSTLFEIAARRGLYVEIVALADSAHYGMDLAALRTQVSATGGIAAGYPNVVVQVANEHYHPTQSRDLHDPDVLAQLGRLIPADVLYTESPATEETALVPAGRFVTRHLSRSGRPAAMLERVELLRGLAAQLSKPVVNDEPIGAAEQDQPGRRLSDPAFFRALAQGTAAAGLPGGTFHCEDGLRSRIPGPVQQACARAWIEGAAISAPSDPRLP